MYIGCICQSVGSGGAVEVASVRSRGCQVPDMASSDQLQLGMVGPSSQDEGTSVENCLQKGKLLDCSEEKNVRKKDCEHKGPRKEVKEVLQAP